MDTKAEQDEEIRLLTKILLGRTATDDEELNRRLMEVEEMKDEETHCHV